MFFVPLNTDPIIAVIKEEDTYEELKKGYTGLYPDPSSVTSQGLTHTATAMTHAGTAMTHAGTAMTPAPPRVTVNAGTSPIWRNVRVFIIFNTLLLQSTMLCLTRNNLTCHSNIASQIELKGYVCIYNFLNLNVFQDSPNRQNRNPSPNNNNNMYPNNNMYSNNNNNYNSRYSVTSPNGATSPPAHPPSIHSAPSSGERKSSVFR